MPTDYEKIRDGANFLQQRKTNQLLEKIARDNAAMGHEIHMSQLRLGLGGQVFHRSNDEVVIAYRPNAAQRGLRSWGKSS